jgi:tRNA-dihydrouridine synthase
MVGRATIGYPWFFREVKHFLDKGELLAPPTMEERVAVCLRHLDFSVRWKGQGLGIVEMRRHYANYFRNIPDFKPFRMRLVTSHDYGEILSTLDEVKTTFSQAA